MILVNRKLAILLQYLNAVDVQPHKYIAGILKTVSWKLQFHEWLDISKARMWVGGTGGAGRETCNIPQ